LIEIYPVVELKDLIYAHRFGWLGPLVRTAKGIMLRPECLLGEAYKKGLTIKNYLSFEEGLPTRALDSLKVMLDHGINSPSFSKAFECDKTPENIVNVYHKLGADAGIAFDVPAKLYVSVAVDLVVKGKVKSEIDPSVHHTVYELADLIKVKLGEHEVRGKRVKERAFKIVRGDEEARTLLRKLSRLAVEATIERLKVMVGHAQKLGFEGLIPVVQGLFEEDVDYCARQLVETMSRWKEEFKVAIGTGGRILSRDDVKMIKFAIEATKRYALERGVSVKFHLLGWSMPSNLKDLEILKEIHSSDSLTVRRRAVEGKIYIIRNGELKLVHVSKLENEKLECDCPACQDPTLKSWILSPSGARKNDVRIVHNVYIISKFLNEALSIY
jgi:hypothetical protein